MSARAQRALERRFFWWMAAMKVIISLDCRSVCLTCFYSGNLARRKCFLVLNFYDQSIFVLNQTGPLLV